MMALVEQMLALHKAPIRPHTARAKRARRADYHPLCFPASCGLMYNPRLIAFSAGCVIRIDAWVN